MFRNTPDKRRNILDEILQESETSLGTFWKTFRKSLEQVWITYRQVTNKSGRLKEQVWIKSGQSSNEVQNKSLTKLEIGRNRPEKIGQSRNTSGRVLDLFQTGLVSWTCSVVFLNLF